MRKSTGDALRAKMSDLLGSNQGEHEVEGALLLVDIARIHTTEQPRLTFAPNEMAQLTESIRQLRQAGQGVGGTGILQPILVRPFEGEDGYVIKAGERRYRAACEVGLTQMPVIVQEDSDEDAFEHALIENIIRHDLTPLEEGTAIKRLMDNRGYSVRDAAKRLGKSKSHVTDRLEVLRAGTDVQAMVSARADTLRHAREIDKIQDAALRAELIRATVEDEASFKAIQERIARAATRVEKQSSASQPNSSDTTISTEKRISVRQILSEALQPAQDLLGTAVQQIENSGDSIQATQRRALTRKIVVLKQHIERLEGLLNRDI